MNVAKDFTFTPVEDTTADFSFTPLRQQGDIVSVVDKAEDIVKVSEETELSVTDSMNFYDELTADRQKRQAAMFDPFNLDGPSGRIGAAPEPTNWQKFKKFFTGDRPQLRPNASRMEKFDRAFDAVVGGPLRVGIKYLK